MSKNHFLCIKWEKIVLAEDELTVYDELLEVSKYLLLCCKQ